MRKIKFRAWNKKKKSMHIVVTLELYFEDEQTFYVSTASQEDIFPEDIELMQYIGLKDKNGKEIFEGDLLKPVKGYDDIYEVRELHTGFGWFEIYDGHFKKWVIMEDQKHAPLYVGTNYIVIGNIHENPELLK